MLALVPMSLCSGRGVGVGVEVGGRVVGWWVAVVVGGREGWVAGV